MILDNLYFPITNQIITYKNRFKHNYFKIVKLCIICVYLSRYFKLILLLFIKTYYIIQYNCIFFLVF